MTKRCSGWSRWKFSGSYSTRSTGQFSPRACCSRSRSSEPLALLHDLPVRVLVEDLVAAELVDVAAAVVELLAVGALAGHHPHAHRAVAGDEHVDVIPAH